MTVIAERSMRRLGDDLYPKQPPTPKQLQAIEEVRDLAICFADLDPVRRPSFLIEVNKLTNGRQRWLATRYTPPGHEAFAPLMAMLDALIEGEGIIKTNKGWFTVDDLRAVESAQTREDGRDIIKFPIRYPWRVKPDEQTGKAGDRLPAVFRRKEDRGPELSTFRVVPRSASKDWWDE